MIEQNARLDKEAQRRLREVTTLYEASQACLAISDQRGLLTAIIEAAARATDAALGSVMLVDEEKGEYVFGAHYGLSEETIAAIEVELHIPLGEGLVGAVVTKGQPVVVADVSTDPRWIPRETKELMRSFLGVPLIGRDGQLLGALNLACPDVDAFDEDHVRLLSTFANQAAMAIENAWLYEQAQQEITERKRAIEALRESEERYRRLVELSFDAIAVHREGKIVYINAAGAELLGASSPEEIIGKPILDFVHPDYSEIAKARVRQTIEGRVAPLIEEKLIRLDGTSVDAEVMEIPITYQGQPAVQVVVRDITERKRAEEALQESEERLRTMVTNVPIVLFAVDREGIFTLSEGKGLRVLGLKPGQVVGISVYDVYRDVPEILDNIRRTLAGEMVISVVNVEGIWFETWYHPVKDQSGEVVGLIGVAADITERKQAEEALRESEEKYRTILENIEDGYYEVDVAGKFTFFNDSLCKIFGYPEDELMGMNDRQLMDDETAKAVHQTFNAIYRTGKPVKALEHELIRKDGTKTFVEVSASLMRGPTGEPAGLRGIIRDITERKRAEEALRESEERLETILNSVQAGIAVIDAETHVIVDANPVAIEIIGVPKEQAVGHLCHKFICPAEEGKCPITDLGQSVDRSECVLLNASGESIPILKSVMPTILGGRRHLIESFLDITERKKAEEELRWLKEFNEGIVQSMTEGIIVEDAEGYLTFVNPSGAALLGYTPDELLGQHWTVIVPPDQQPIIQAAHERRAWGEADRYDIELIRRDGTRVPTLISGSPRFEEGRFAGTLAVFTDITERKQAEEALRESEERYRALYEDNPSMYFTVDTEGTVLSVNQFGAEQLGYTVEELVGRSVLNVFYEEDRKSVLKQLTICLQNPTEIAHWEFRKVRKDGSVLWVKEAARAVRGADGHTVVLIVCEDITERKKLEGRLRQAQKMEAIGTLAGGIAHDFNNLLTPIGGFAELLLRKTSEGSQQYEYLRQIKVAAERATTLTSRLLTFARRGRVEVHPLSLNDVAREVIGLLERTIDKAIAIEPYLADDLATIEGDASQLYQVLLNLCLNARDAMPDGGRLIIETQNVTLSEAKARTELDLEAGQYVLLSVTDTGIGMDAKIQQRLFEPFFTTKEEGRGLGLAMVYGIVRGHGGAIHVYSESGQGSTFKVYLPGAGRLVEDTGPQEVEVMGGTETVLVVDDEEPVRALLQRILEEGGYTVLLATDGVEAVELYARLSTEIDLVVLDIVMPRMGGRKTYERLWEINPEVKVLLSSGGSENGQARNILAAGARGFLQKPYDLRAVLRKVREALEG